MAITELASVGSAGSSLSASRTNEMGKDAFLELLVTQLQCQDPLNPMDSTAFTAQLAQFSSLEQLNNVNKNLEYSQLYQASINNSQAVSFIGKEITATGDSISINNGAPASLSFELDAAANEVVVNIYDSSDNLVKIMTPGAIESGEQTMEWDGTDNNGNAVADGEYQFEIMAYDSSGESVNATTYTTGQVKGVTFKDGIAGLLVGSMTVPLGNIIEVKN